MMKIHKIIRQYIESNGWNINLVAKKVGIRR